MPNSQEKLAGALSYIFFFIPMIMKDMKTEYTMWHSKQSLLILLLQLVLGVAGWILGIIHLGFIASLTQFILVLVTLWCLYQAYMGNKFIVPILGENMNTWIAKLGLTKMFEVQK